MKTLPAITFKLSWWIAGLMAIASAGGLWLDGLYRDNEYVRAAWYGNDCATLTMAIPALIASILLSQRGNERAVYIWLGLLAYALYNYAFYLFGATFNKFFLIYLAIFTLAIYALVTGISALDVRSLADRFRKTTPVRWVAGILLFIAIPLTLVEFLMAFKFVVTTELPETVVATGHVTAVVFALDLSLVMPNLILASVLLWKRRPWGYLLGAMMSVVGFFYMISLVFATLQSSWSTPDKLHDPFLPFYVLVGLMSGLAGYMLLKSYSGEGGRQTMDG